MPFLLVPMLIASCSSSPTTSGLLKSSKEGINQKKSPASKEDIFFYRAIGTNIICNARSEEVEFSKAVRTSVRTYAQVLQGKHGGVVASQGEEQLPIKQIYGAAEFQVISGAMRFCPESVPDDVKTLFEEAIEKEKRSINSKN